MFSYSKIRSNWRWISNSRMSRTNLLWLQSNDIDKLSAKWRKKGKGVQLKDSEKFTMNSLVGILQFEITKKTGRYWHEIKPNQEIKPIFPEKLGWRLTVRNEICSWTGWLDYEKLFYLLPNSLESFLNEMDWTLLSFTKIQNRTCPPKLRHIS